MSYEGSERINNSGGLPSRALLSLPSTRVRILSLTTTASVLNILLPPLLRPSLSHHSNALNGDAGHFNMYRFPPKASKTTDGTSVCEGLSSLDVPIPRVLYDPEIFPILPMPTLKNTWSSQNDYQKQTASQRLGQS